ncbi:MAG: antibiotic biosynthesis monooxygenase family protein [Beijerinckiaceae bacterium]|jgi:heme-degrading monooxygenase HmoA|nr:antibiotic biosynthesis monooxygenase family protein [Beijerinckiaceae bacterium]
MTYVRLIHVKVPQDQMAKAEKIWREDCGPLMKLAPGCMEEELLKCMDAPGEYISYSEWESEAAIETYRKSEAHHEIQKHSRALQGAQAEVKRYVVIP